MYSQEWGRFSYIGFSPFLVIRSKEKQVEIISNKGKTKFQCNPFEALRKIIREYTFSEIEHDFPFTGGAVGYFSYDFGRQIENITEISKDDISWPDFEFGLYDTIIVVDNLTGEVYICSSGFPEINKTRRFERAKNRIEAFYRVLINSTPKFSGRIHVNNKKLVGRSFTEDEFCKAVETVKEHIRCGDVYVLNLSQRFTLEFRSDPWSVYRRLRELNPTCYSAYLNFAGHIILSNSPECFLRVRNGKVLTKPIKGTRPRSLDKKMDEKLEKELKNDKKERAELAMIIDLERNDLSRVCKPLSVKVTNLYSVEKYSTVFQLTSTIEGDLRDDVDIIDLIKATFPGGSVTGAPKLSAMKIIEQIEPVRRGLYTGSIGYIGFNKNSEFNIVIRSILCKNNMAYINVGSGITIYSLPEKEYIETLHKAKAMFMALEVDDGLEGLL